MNSNVMMSLFEPRQLIDMAVVRTGACTGLDLFFDMSADAPLILCQSYVLFKMPGWSWTAPKIGGS
jgi:hypothetical protein